MLVSSGSAQPGQLRDSSPFRIPWLLPAEDKAGCSLTERLTKDPTVIILAVAEKGREGQGTAKWTHGRTQPHSVTGQKATGFWP